jgi:ATP-binding cassette, subfamily B, bacterial PglK
VKQSLRKLYQLFSRREKIKAAGLFVLMTMSALAEMVGIGAVPAFILIVASPYKVMTHPISGAIVGWLGIETDRQLLVVGSVGLIAFFLLKGFLVSVINYVRIRFVQHKYIDLSGRLFASYMLAPYAFHLNRNTSELLRNLMSETSLVVNQVFMPLMTLVLNLVTMLFILALLMAVQPLFTLFALSGLGGVTYLLMKAVEKKMGSYGRQEMLHRQVSNKAVMEGLAGVKDARVMGRENNFVSRFKDSNWMRAKAQFFKDMVNSLQRPLFETITVMGVLGLALILTVKDESIEGIVAVLALFAAATYRLMPTFRDLLGSINTLQYHIASVNPVYDDIMLLRHSLKERHTSPDKAPMPFNNHITIDKVSYSYPGTNVKVLDNISVQIQSGTAIALVGESGAGKTTLVDALLGLLEIQEGSILVDGVDIRTDSRAWQMNIGYIPQVIYLTDDTLKRNVAFGLDDNDIDDDKFWQAVKAARLEELTDKLADREHTVIGERGIRLSGGQRQRVGIARALYHNPTLLIMDEGTSALDNITERYVIDAIERLKGDRTIVMIAHRLTTVKNCDVICLMENGKITDMGSYGELLQRNARFREMAGEGNEN